MMKKDSKKFLMIVLGILLMSVFGLSIVYAALSVTLNITGSARVTSADWDVLIENVSIRTEGKASVLSNPTIDSTSIKNFSVSLSQPGDGVFVTFYVSNRGGINANFVNANMNTITTTGYNDYISNNFTYGLYAPEETSLNVGESRMFVYEISWNEEATTLPGNSSEIVLSNLGATILYEQE